MSVKQPIDLDKKCLNVNGNSQSLNNNSTIVVAVDKIDEDKQEKKKKLFYEFDLNKEPETIDEWLNEIQNLIKNLLIGNVEQSKFIFRQRAHLSFFYEICVTFMDFLDSLLKLDKENLEKALHSVTATNATANKHRKKMGLIGYLIRSDFSKHTDLEVYAEAAHAFTQIMNAFIIALMDQGIYGMVNAGIKAKTSYSSIKNCIYVLEDKMKWESAISQKNFEANTRVFIGIYDLIISFCPSKIARILDLIGFNSDRINALTNIRKSFEIKDTCVNELALVVLMIYHLFLSFFFGIGEVDVKFICDSTKRWDKVESKEVFLYFGKGSKDMVLGNPQSAIRLFEEAIEIKGHYRQISYCSYWQLVWANWYFKSFKIYLSIKFIN